MLRKILQFLTARGLELKVIHLVKRISLINRLLLRNGWKDQSKEYYRNIYRLVSGVLLKNNVPLSGKTLLEIGSGNEPLLGNFFIEECGVAKFIASDPYRETATTTAPGYNDKLLSVKLDFTSTGNVAQYEDQLDLVISNAVLEHIKKSSCAKTIGNLNRVLKMDGYSFHQIDLRDHLSRIALPFNFFKYSDDAWDAATSNTIFYTNRLRSQNWIELFEKNGFRIAYLHKYRELNPRFPTKIDDVFTKTPTEDLNVSALDILVQKVTEISTPD
jgi:2-polyprenyl-3-methyl-5-hydroxy-6-metoxy-1,4-benzoquinol methylase